FAKTNASALSAPKEITPASASGLTTFLDAASWIALLIIMVLAVRVMFFSPTIEVYESNKSIFHEYGFIFTIVYFICAYWAFKRAKANQLAANKTGTSAKE